jgi:hypothetical protein
MNSSGDPYWSSKGDQEGFLGFIDSKMSFWGTEDWLWKFVICYVSKLEKSQGTWGWEQISIETFREGIDFSESDRANYYVWWL